MPLPPQRLPAPIRLLLAAMVWLGLLAALLPPAQAQAVDLPTLQVQRRDGELTLDFSARLHPSKAVEEALSHGVPVYFVAQATLLRARWYWRDERVARLRRSWRLAYQPLTSNWRVGVGAVTRTYPTLTDALAAIGSTSGWKLADLHQLDPDARYTVEFSFRLDTSQLPSPMQIGLTGQDEWQLAIERTLRVD